MTNIKPLPKKSEPRINSADGLRFGLGFWMAWAIITLLFLPAVACLIVLFLPLLTGYSLP
jgi:hypothetical protein